MTNNVYVALIFLIDTLFTLFIGAVLLRFLLQWIRADFYNPLSQVIVKITNPLLLPLRKFIPGYRGLDIAALLLVLLLEVVNIIVLILVSGNTLPNAAYIAYWSVLKSIALLVNLYIFTIFIQALLSWINPGSYNPFTSILWALNEPLLRPLRKLMPPISGLDFSPLLAIIGLYVINILIPLPPLLR